MHAGREVHKNDRVSLERLARSRLRPALALDRLAEAPDDTLLYDQSPPEPPESLPAALSAAASPVPSAEGAPRSSKQGVRTRRGDDVVGADDAGRQRWLDWAELQRRAYAIDVLPRLPRCNRADELQDARGGSERPERPHPSGWCILGTVGDADRSACAPSMRMRVIIGAARRHRAVDGVAVRCARA